MLEVGESVLDATVVVVLVEEPETVLVVERRPLATLTETTVAGGAVLVIQRRTLGERVLGVDDEVLMGIDLGEPDAAAVVADDAADGVDAFFGGAVRGVEERGKEAGQLRGRRGRRAIHRVRV